MQTIQNRALVSFSLAFSQVFPEELVIIPSVSHLNFVYFLPSTEKTEKFVRA